MKNQSIASLIVGIAILGGSLSGCGNNRATSVEPITPAEVDAAALADSDTLAAQNFPSKIIGINPLVKVKADGSNLDANLRAKIDAFGLLAIAATPSNSSSGFCSATHIGNGYVITAGHCFFNESAPGPQKKVNAACPELKVHWGYRGSPATGSASPVVTSIGQCTSVVYAELSATRDFGIFKVDHAPSVSVPLANDNARPAPNTKLTIFGYPQARPLEWSQYCPLVKTIAAAAKMPASRFAYQCDTEPGNSGSAVLSVSPTGDLRVVGIHDAAAPDTLAYNIATYLFDARQVLSTNGVNLNQLVGSN